MRRTARALLVMAVALAGAAAGTMLAGRLAWADALVAGGLVLIRRRPGRDLAAGY